MFEFYQSKPKPQYRLVIRKGDAFPAEAEGGDWKLAKTVETIDATASAAIAVKGYYLYRMDGFFEESVARFD
jgi:hypothetical protein